MPGGYFAGIGPVELSPVLLHTSDPPVPSGVVVSGTTPFIPLFRLLLELSDLSIDSASAAEDFFPERIFLGLAGFHRNDLARTRRVPTGSGRLRAGPSRVGEFHAIAGYAMYRIRNTFVLSQGSRNVLCWFVPFGMDSEVPCRSSGTYALWILRALVCTECF